jgi:hypothetical protein
MGSFKHPRVFHPLDLEIMDRVLRSLRRAPLCYSGPGHAGEAQRGVAAMTIDDAKQIAPGLIQSYIGPDHKVIDMKAFFGALVHALKVAHEQGRVAAEAGRPSFRP